MQPKAPRENTIPAIKTKRANFISTPYENKEIVFILLVKASY